MNEGPHCLEFCISLNSWGWGIQCLGPSEPATRVGACAEGLFSMQTRVCLQFGCPYAKDANSGKAGTGGPQDGTFDNLKTGATEKRFGGGNIKDEHTSRDTNAPGEPGGKVGGS